MLSTVQKAWGASERIRGYEGLGMQEGQLSLDEGGNMLPPGRVHVGSIMG